jgi:SAM-dependent methyltransferase
LDVGCGFGQSLGYHTARGCEVWGVEADENIRRVAEKFGYKVHVGLFDDRLYEGDYFDYVTMDQVIEHVTDPHATLKGVAKILKPGGKLILSTPNGRGWGARLFKRRWINWHAPYHLQFFTPRSMSIAAEKSGLTLLDVKTITNSEWLFYQLAHLLTYPQPCVSSWFWSPSKGTSSLASKFGVRLLSLMHKTKISHLVTRIFDGIGAGDNYVYVLAKR